MKKTKLLVLLAGLLAFTLFSCSNNASSDSNKETESEKTGNEGSEETEDIQPDEPAEPVYMEFGSWPQSAKNETVTITAEKETVKGQVRHKGSDGAWYVYLEANGKNNYYKIEPIKWRVITYNYNSSGKTLLFAEKVLMNCEFYDYSRDSLGNSASFDRTIDGKTVYANNYKHSRVRAFLNGISYKKADENGENLTDCNDFLDKGFLQLAFSDSELAKISSSIIDNSSITTFPDNSYKSNDKNDFTCSTLNDKIFLLSEQEITREKFGFENNYGGNCEQRVREKTDYAKGPDLPSIYVSSNDYWWLRSPSNTYYDCTQVVDYHGNTLHPEKGGCSKSHGVVPALCINN